MKTRRRVVIAAAIAMFASVLVAPVASATDAPVAASEAALSAAPAAPADVQDREVYPSDRGPLMDEVLELREQGTPLTMFVDDYGTITKVEPKSAADVAPAAVQVGCNGVNSCWRGWNLVLAYGFTGLGTTTYGPWSLRGAYDQYNYYGQACWFSTPLGSNVCSPVMIAGETIVPSGGPVDAQWVTLSATPF